ncbi:imelysin family protein [Manganibacter manganicus]|uniref:Peptidase M75, Imelysin n=1 Tax=Manganibacter manganicus TaxID=1873176 RepID=A0A1V8RTH6_9HYPH|nr:imelysin family protein [Pseudaminobacter manganicus]OQM76487.1 peptidase M75, Imelysin [Pseudaminobacter manganicus]
MPKRFALALVLPLLLDAAPPASAAVQASDVISRAVDGFIRPAYAALSENAAAMSGGMDALCAKPSRQDLDAARKDYAALVGAWSKVEFIRFGPITKDNRLERILFWPDRKSIGLRQVQAALASQDSTATDPASIAGKSVAMQGLGALEFVLYGTGADDLAGKAGTYRCAYGRTIAGNIEKMAAEVSVEWHAPDGFATVWKQSGPDNAIYRDGNEAVTELMGVFIDGLEMIRDVRVKGFLSANPDDDRPKGAIYWRSTQTAASLAANLEGMAELFKASELGEALPPEAGWMAQSVDILLTNGIADAKAASGPIKDVLADPARRARLEHYALVTSSLSALIGTRMSAEFGLTAGFSSLDGD